MPIQLSNQLSQVNTEVNCNAKLVSFLDWQSFTNISVQGFFPIITNEFPQIIQYFQLGLVPIWAKNIAMGAKMGKTKKENLVKNDALQAIYQYKRCIIPATAFTIWANQKKTDTLEIKAATTKCFFLLGLWSVWGEGMQTFSVITQKQTYQNNLMDIPIGIEFEEKDKWLDKRTVSLSLLNTLKTTSFI